MSKKTTKKGFFFKKEQDKIKKQEEPKKISITTSYNEFLSSYQSMKGRNEHEEQRQQQILMLFKIIKEKKWEQAEKFLKMGCPINLPLFFPPHPKAIKEAALLKPQAPSGTPEWFEGTLLMWLADQNDEEGVNWALKNGAEVALLSRNGRDASWMAMEKGFSDMAYLLLGAGARSNLRLQETPGHTRLMKATMTKDLDIVTYLLKKGVKPNSVDDLGKTALHYCLAQNPFTAIDREIALLLMELGGDLNAADGQGYRAHEYAKEEIPKMVIEEFLLRQAAKGINIVLENSFEMEMAKKLGVDPFAPKEEPSLFNDNTLNQQVKALPKKPIRPKVRGY